jgi:hypothetical protein
VYWGCKSFVVRGSSLSGMRMGFGGDCGRRRNPRNGILGVMVWEDAGELEYTDEPLIIDRTLLCRAPNREDVCEAGDASRGGRSSGRGVRRNNGNGMAEDTVSGNVL